MTVDLQGKAALVTGASTGIGAAAAVALAGAGARLAVHYNRSRPEAEAVAQTVRDGGGEAVLVQGDLRDSAVVERVVREAEGGLGRIDILVNNAGDLMGRHSVEDVTDDFVLDMFRLNALSTIAACRAVVPGMRAAGSGAIVNMSSVAARTGGSPGTMFYAATKSYVASLTRSMAKAYAADGIRVNAVGPGVIATPIHDRHTPPEVLGTLASTIPMGRIGGADEVADVILFLASDRSRYMTGQVLEVNGGMWMG